jgi:AraC-like DNA-binding protein
MRQMSDREMQRDASNRKELAEIIAAMLPNDGIIEPMEGLRLTRASQPTERMHGVSKPCFCVIAQGAKEVFLGESRYEYDCERYYLATVELPATGRVLQASKEEPYLAFRFELDPGLVGSVMVEAGLAAPHGPSDSKAIIVSPLGSDLLDATVRLMRLVSKSKDERVLMPMIKRELTYLLLIGEQGSRLRHLPMLGGHSDRIAKAVDRLRNDFDRPMRIDEIARDLGMSASGFHHHFKVVTDMSPLQYQKQIRLQEARRLMLGESMDAASAGYRVGYEDPSHFSRDYKRQFGFSPMRDIERLRSMVTAD